VLLQALLFVGHKTTATTTSADNNTRIPWQSLCGRGRCGRCLSWPAWWETLVLLSIIFLWDGCDQTKAKLKWIDGSGSWIDDSMTLS
jgi:hypothetical protein